MAETATLQKNRLTGRDIVKMALPVIFEQLFTFLYPIVNTLLVSGADTSAVSGVGMIDQINSFLCLVFSLVAAGVGVVASQYFGRRDMDALRHSARQGFTLSLTLATLVMVLILLFAGPITSLILYGADDGIHRVASGYLRVLGISFPFYALYLVATALLRGMGKMKQGMIASITMTIVTLISSVVLVRFMGLGITGAALAPTIGKLAGTAVGLVFLMRSKLAPKVTAFFTRHFDFSHIRKLLYFGMPASAEVLGLMLVRIIINIVVINNASAADVDANVLGATFLDFQTMGHGAPQAVAATLVGFAKGQGDEDLARRYLRFSVLLAFVGGTVLSWIVYPFLPSILGLYENLSQEAIDIAMKIFLGNALASTFLAAPAFTTQAAYRGAGDAKFCTAVSMSSIIIVRLSVSWLLAVHLNMGAFGVWLSYWSDWAVRAVIFGSRYFTHNWFKGKAA